MSRIQKSYEDTSFVAGDSPRILDFKTDVGIVPKCGYLICDGAGDLLCEISHDGTNYDNQFTIKSGEKIECLGTCDVAKFRITHSGSDSSYRILVY